MHQIHNVSLVTIITNPPQNLFIFSELFHHSVLEHTEQINIHGWNHMYKQLFV